MTDIIERLRIESRREPHEPIWRDAIDEIEALREAVRLNACESRASTHADDCWSWGPGHYKCAVKEIKTLQAKCDALREALETMVEMAEMNGVRAYAMDVARAALKQEKGGSDVPEA